MVSKLTLLSNCFFCSSTFHLPLLFLIRFAGTPCYMAPEVLKKTPYSFQADVFSFAIVLCELIVGKYPCMCLSKCVYLCFSHPLRLARRRERARVDEDVRVRHRLGTAALHPGHTPRLARAASAMYVCVIVYSN